MNKLQFKISINASRSKVWGILWSDETYPKWTLPFSEGSHAITDWKKGSKVLFLDGNGHGMVSRVEENMPNEFMSIKHLGEVKDGVEDTTSDRVKQWAGAHENYIFSEKDGVTTVTLELAGEGIGGEMAEMFAEKLPRGLAKLKEIVER